MVEKYARREEEVPFPKPEVEQAYRAIVSSTEEAKKHAAQVIMQAYTPFEKICGRRKMELARVLSKGQAVFEDASSVKYGIEEKMGRDGKASQYEVYSVQVEFGGIKRRITAEVGQQSIVLCLNQTGSDAKLLEMVSYGKNSGVEIFREGSA